MLTVSPSSQRAFAHSCGLVNMLESLQLKPDSRPTTKTPWLDVNDQQRTAPDLSEIRDYIHAAHKDILDIGLRCGAWKSDADFRMLGQGMFFATKDREERSTKAIETGAMIDDLVLQVQKMADSVEQMRRSWVNLKTGDLDILESPDEKRSRKDCARLVQSLEQESETFRDILILVRETGIGEDS